MFINDTKIGLKHKENDTVHLSADIIEEIDEEDEI